jgi:hypothetical protein
MKYLGLKGFPILTNAPLSTLLVKQEIEPDLVFFRVIGQSIQERSSLFFLTRSRKTWGTSLFSLGLSLSLF